MKEILTSSILALTLFNVSLAQDEKSKAEIIQAEKDFCRMAKDKGIAAAFYAFADDSAVIKRGPTVIKGKEKIRKFYLDQKQTGELKWAPAFVEVSGILGYTYGEFIYSEKDPSGQMKETKGIFHTVWKKQKDGTWKFVWD